ncbi:MAG TPA: glycosyltransferase family 9 protein [Vicinamibacterales bacterium]
MSRLTITDRRERALVAAADATLSIAALARSSRSCPTTPERIVCLRLERIGDLLMTVPAIADLKAAFPDASLDLVVGSWNRDIAAAIPAVACVETLDAAWLSRNGNGEGLVSLLRDAAGWRSRHYDIAVNFEPDIRSNLVMAAIGARWTAGFASGGGGALLDTALAYDTTIHTTDNARALVNAITGGAARRPEFALAIPEVDRKRAAQLLARFDGARQIGIHVSGGRAIKQWPESRFREVAERLVHGRDAAIVLTGTADDRAQVNGILAALPPDRVVDLSGDQPLLTVAAVLERLDLFVTGDTGPMHLAHAVGTPIVAIFGPSQPVRYGPRGVRDRVVRIDLPCSPCNRIRVPPARCTGHTPDCMAGVDVASVLAAIDEVLGGGTR